MSWEQSRTYRFVRKAVQIFTKKMNTVWQTQFINGPSVFICNHDRAFGPIAMCGHFELYKDVSPWINAQVLSSRDMPSYVRKDYWWKPGKWYSKICDYTLAYLCSLILPPILRGSACVPVYHDTGVIKTLKMSVNALRSGRHLVLFPERPTGYCQYDNEIINGFVSIGRLYYRRTKQILNFYPTYIDWSGKTISVAKPIPYDPEMTAEQFALTVSTAVEEHFHEHGKETLPV